MGVVLSRILPPPEGEAVGTSIRVPKAMLKRIDDVAEESGHSRTDVILHFLRWALQEYELERAEKRTKK